MSRQADWRCLGAAVLIAVGSQHEWMRMLAATVTGGWAALLTAMWFMQGEDEG